VLRGSAATAGHTVSRRAASADTAHLKNAELLNCYRPSPLSPDKHLNAVPALAATSGILGADATMA
jgi:hypothetical protein